MKHLIALCWLGAISVFGVELTREQRAFLNKNEPILVHNEADYKPYDFYENGSARGYCVDYIKKVARNVGMEIEFVSGKSWQEYMQMIKDKEIDIITDMAKTPKRQEFIAYTQSYVLKRDTIFVNKKQHDPKTLQSLQDFKGKTLAVVDGYYEEEILRTNYPGIELVEKPNTLESFKAVAFSEVDGVMSDMGVGRHVIIDHGLHSLEVAFLIQNEFFTRPLHLAVHKDNAILRDILQKGMDAIDPKEIQKLEKKWLLLGRKYELLTPRQRFMAVTGALALLVGLVFIWYRYRLIQKYSAHLREENRQRRVLLRELDHRVKNNLQLISSIISLHTNKSDPHEAMQDIQNMVAAISTAHNKIEPSTSSDSVELCAYLHDLAHDLLPRKVFYTHVQIQCKPLQIDVAKAAVIGIIVNECVINSLKYAFESTLFPALTLSVTPKEKSFVLRIADNGRGFGNTKESDGLGAEIIELLASGKLGAKTRFYNDFGATVELEVPYT